MKAKQPNASTMPPQHHHHQAQLDFSDQVLVQLSLFPMNQLWRYVVDGQLQQKEGGWEQYDAREPGSVSAAIRAMAFALSYVTKAIDLDLIRQLHITCGTGVKLERKVPLGVFNNDGVYVQILPTVSTPQGIQQFLLSHPPHNIQGVLFICDEISNVPAVYHGHKAALTKAITIPLNHYTHQDCPGCRQKLFESEKILSKEHRIVYYPPKSYSPQLHENLKELLVKGYCKDGYEEKSLEEHTQDVIDAYEKEQRELDTPQKRSVSALLATQELVRLHPFSDLVNRVFVNCLHFLMDIKNGYMPPLFFEPNIFEFSHLELLQQQIAVGQQRAFQCIDHPESTVYGVSVPRNVPIPEKLREATELFMSNLAKQLFFASKKYSENHPMLAAHLLSRACFLLSQVKNRPAILYAGYLKEWGLCLKRTQQNDALEAVVRQLRELAKVCRSESSRHDFSNFDEIIDRIIKQLNSNEVPQSDQKSIHEKK